MSTREDETAPTHGGASATSQGHLEGCGSDMALWYCNRVRRGGALGYCSTRRHDATPMPIATRSSTGQ